MCIFRSDTTELKHGKFWPHYACLNFRIKSINVINLVKFKNCIELYMCVYYIDKKNIVKQLYKLTKIHIEIKVL